MPTDHARPVSSTLEQQLVDARNRHHIVVWLDRHDQYSPFVDAHTAGLDKPALLVHAPLATEVGP